MPHETALKKNKLKIQISKNKIEDWQLVPQSDIWLWRLAVCIGTCTGEKDKHEAGPGKWTVTHHLAEKEKVERVSYDMTQLWFIYYFSFVRAPLLFFLLYKKFWKHRILFHFFTRYSCARRVNWVSLHFFTLFLHKYVWVSCLWELYYCFSFIKILKTWNSTSLFYTLFLYEKVRLMSPPYVSITLFLHTIFIWEGLTRPMSPWYVSLTWDPRIIET